MQVYMAGPLFTAAERRWNRDLAAALRASGLEVFLPQESAQNEATDFSARKIFNGDLEGLQASQVVLAWLDGPDPDSGTCWEYGWAVRARKLVIGYTTDLRFQGASDGPYDLNLMMTQSAPVLRFVADVSPEEIASTVMLVVEKRPVE